jgi:hypothetical protein
MWSRRFSRTDHRQRSEASAGHVSTPFHVSREPRSTVRCVMRRRRRTKVASCLICDCAASDRAFAIAPGGATCTGVGGVVMETVDVARQAELIILPV